MARNVMQNEFRTSKMAEGSHLSKISKKIKKVIFGHPKWPPAAIL